MKNYLYILITTVLAASCANYLDTAPADQLASSTMWTTESLADAGMAGLYRNFYVTTMTTDRLMLRASAGIQGINRHGWMAMEFQCNHIGSSVQVEALTKAEKSANDFIVTYEWQWCYTGIHRINDALENLHKAGLDEEKYERYICEAKFLRAWYYSRLNKIYQGVPLYLEVISDEECTKGQSTSAEVWEAVINDLTDCIDNENFPDNTLGASNYGRPSRGAAYSLRGQAYLWLAWENGDDASYYQLAADDFEKVSDCGYGLWAGSYIDFFNYDNEKDHEMIFPIQFTEDTGYCDYLQMILGFTDSYGGWSHIRPSFDFVSYFQNSDGSKFDWTDRIPEWNDAVFTDDVTKREVFFLRDSISVDADGIVVRDYWDETQANSLQERVNAIGLDVFNRYYLKDGNEDRIRSCYNDRDPRLKDIVLTPYDPYDCYSASYNGGENMYGKEMRWPYIKNNQHDRDDIAYGNAPHSMYLFKKYVYHYKGEMVDVDSFLRCQTDWPLIRYTDVYLLLAECYAHLGRLSEAVGIVNEIRARAGMPSVATGSFDEVMEAIRYERRIELCAEGHDFFDEWRWGTYQDMKFQGRTEYGSQSVWGQWDAYIVNWYYTDNMWPYGAPASECERNPNLTRKEGWAY